MVVVAVIGAQYGSEGKGVIVNELAPLFQIHVRVGGPNAGHSFYHQGKLWKMQGIPCGWTNPEARLVIGAGAVVDLALLGREVAEIEAAGYSVRDRLYIDEKAAVLDDRHHAAEGGVTGEIHTRIGSTGEGVGAARLARVSREPSAITLYGEWDGTDLPDGLPSGSNTARLLELERRANSNILLEGTQGSALSNIHGPWPFVTSADTNAATLAADCGIPPKFIRTLMVARTFPIRVAGNSGPMKDEVDWDFISKRTGKITTEHTTVTKKIRRIGKWDPTLLERATTLNEPDWIALTFLDYFNPKDEGKVLWSDISPESMSFIRHVEQIGRAPVMMAGTGGEYWRVAMRPAQRFHWLEDL